MKKKQFVLHLEKCFKCKIIILFLLLKSSVKKLIFYYVLTNLFTYLLEIFLNITDNNYSYWPTWTASVSLFFCPPDKERIVACSRWDNERLWTIFRIFWCLSVSVVFLSILRRAYKMRKKKFKLIFIFQLETELWFFSYHKFHMFEHREIFKILFLLADISTDIWHFLLGWF